MRTVSVNTGWTELQAALKEIKQSWEDTRLLWNDRVSDDFDEGAMKPIEADVKAVLRGTERLGQLFTQVQTECG